MAFIDLFLQRNDLMEPDTDEEKDLELHVRQCTRRWKALDLRTARVEFLTWAILLVLIADRIIDIHAILGK